MTLITVAVVCFLVLATRFLFLLSPVTNAATSDRHYYVWLAKNLGKTISLSDRSVANSIVRQMLDAPILPYVFFGKMSDKTRVIALVFLNALSDCATILITLFFVRDFIPQEKVIAFALCLSVFPSWLPANARMTSLGGRAIGPMIFALLFFAIMSVGVDSTWAYVFFLVGAFVMLNTSIFGFQAILVFSLMLLCFGKVFYPLISFGLFGLGFFMPGLKAQNLGRFYHHRFYIKYIKFSGRKLFHPIKLNPFYMAEVMLRKNPLGIGFVFLMPMTYLIIWGPSLSSILSVNHFDGISYLLMMSSFSFVAYILTLVPPGAIWGEAERYLEYGAPFAVSLFCILAPIDHILLMTSVSLGVVCLNYLILHKKEVISSLDFPGFSPELIEVGNFLNQIPPSGVLVSPAKLSCPLDMICNSRHKFFYHGYVEKEGFDIWLRVFADGANQFSDDPQILRSLGGQYLILDKAYISKFPICSGTLITKLENSSYVIKAL